MAAREKIANGHYKETKLMYLNNNLMIENIIVESIMIQRVVGKCDNFMLTYIDMDMLNPTLFSLCLVCMKSIDQVQ